ncbi:hypothetical protein BJY52DRAFT_1392187 [Lactarius psammicola]|nr:hypothetical protein BJY52DRAFT_1392187 [Lactarius psammicola]
MSGVRGYELPGTSRCNTDEDEDEEVTALGPDTESSNSDKDASSRAALSLPSSPMHAVLMEARPPSNEEEDEEEDGAAHNRQGGVLIVGLECLPAPGIEQVFEADAGADIDAGPDADADMDADGPCPLARSRLKLSCVERIAVAKARRATGGLGLSPPLAVLAHTAMCGFTLLLDAAVLAPTTPIDLTSTPVDAVAVSFYKMFGFPTSIGALVLAPGIGAWLREKRPWFAGGTVDVVQVPGLAVGRTAAIDEAFEDDTLNYTLLPAVTTGLRLLGGYLPALPACVATLSALCTWTLEDLRWPRSGSPAEPANTDRAHPFISIFFCILFNNRCAGPTLWRRKSVANSKLVDDY